MAEYDLGLLGLAVMGQNLVLNMESRGYSVAVFNRTTSKMTDFVHERCRGKRIGGFEDLKDFCASLKRPRKVMLMVKAGEAVDDFIDKVLPHLEQGDILIDGGNSFFGDTIRRAKSLESKGFLYIGTGVSG
ncbi:MAG TPA: NAD(P)-binding domain-containing protein, partial [Planctomycetota bacterium]|nr:NAD(P)-binding domain-containing protein [Planctomycetota bacterium]